MSYSAYALLVLLGALIYLLYTEKLHPAVSFFLVVSALVILGVLTPQEALTGFSNEQIAVIALLLIVSSIIKKFEMTGLIFSKILGNELSYSKFLLKMMGTVSFLSAFLNNTPVVATFMPYVYQWGKKRGIPPSKLLIPLSYAAILGGTTTLIGTSTNLIVSALAVESGLKPLGLFDFFYAGFPAVLAGVLYMLLFGHRLLPYREDLISSFLKGKRDYLIETNVPRFSPIIGKTVLEAGLRNLKGLFLVEIIRGSERIAPVSPKDVIREGDILIFAGDTNSIVELVKERGALSLPEVCSFALKNEKIEIVEALIPVNSSLVGKKVRETDFRAKFDAAIIAIHRDGERLKGKIGEMVLKPGDLLLLLAGKDFWSRVKDSDDIYVVNKVDETLTVDSKRALIFLGLFLFSILLAAFGVFPLFKSLLILLAVVVLLKMATYGEIKKSIDLNIIIMAAFSFAVGIAIAKTGLADFVAQELVGFAGVFGIVGALISIYVITNILTEFVTNVAAATMVFPVALSVSKFYAAPPEIFILTVAYGASASFMTPIGYQTNLMVYGPGNYRFRDFLRVGFPLSLIFMLVIISTLVLRTKGGF